MKEWRETGRGNLVKDFDGFFVSYQDFTNPHPIMGVGFFGPDSDSPETALCVEKEYYILNGDYRKEYERLKSLERCMEFYHAHKLDQSSWSNT